MKLFITVLATLLFSTAAFAQNVSGIYYDVETNGEGIFVLHNETQKRVAWSLYTYNPPFEDCETIDEVLIEGEPTEVDEFKVCFEGGNDTEWYVGSDPYDGSAYGLVYKSEAYEYPEVFDGDLSETEVVGFYILDKSETGMFLIITPQGDADAPDTLFRAYDLDTVLFNTGD